MIVECESCHTRFRLAEERIPATGAKVRCSRCKTAFIVHRPGVSRDERIAEVVAEATGPGGSRTPEATQDIFETTGSAMMTLSGDVEPPTSAGAPPTAASPATSDEEKWEFDEEPRKGAAPKAAGTPRVAAKSKPAEIAEADDLDALGSPEDWDLLGNGAGRIAEEARFEAPPSAPPVAKQAAPAAAEERAAAPQRSVESAIAAAAAEPLAATAASPGWLQALRDVAQSGVDGGVWIAAVALCSAGLALSLSPRSEADATVPPAPTAVLEGERVAVSVHAIESGVGGMLAVVRGQLPSGGSSTAPSRLRAAWLDAQGAPIAGASAIAGPPVADHELRELSVERLHAEHEARALELTAGGAFEAVFESVPEQGASLSLTRERVPAPAPVATHEGEEALAATGSSRPSDSPSSE